MSRLSPPPIPDWILAQLGEVERYALDVGGQRMHVMEAGDPDGRPVLAVHGNPTWGFLYRRIVAALRGEPLRFVLPDLIGFGFSDKPSSPADHTLEAHAGWLASAVGQLGLRDVIFLGQDWGGPIGALGLGAHEGAMTGAVILNTVLREPREGFRPTLFHRFSQTPVISDLAFRGLGFPQGALWSAQGDRRSIRGAVARAYRYPLRGWSRRVAPLATARMVPDSSAHPSIPALQRCRAQMEAFEGPAAIVWGDRDPVLARACNATARILPQAEVTHTQAGHFLQEEVPDVIAAAVKRVAAAR